VAAPFATSVPRARPPRAIAIKLSILQAEFSLTQVLDQPVTGRIFFEEVIRENLDIGRPTQVSLVFDRKINPQRAAALVFADPRLQSLLHILLLFLLIQCTFTHKDVRKHLAPLLGKKPSQLTPGRITYDLRRLRLHGLIERIPKTHCYRITAKGLRAAIFYTRLYNRSLRAGLAIVSSHVAASELPMAAAIRAAETAVNTWYDQTKLAS
jgi:hypothetical protein